MIFKLQIVISVFMLLADCMISSKSSFKKVQVQFVKVYMYRWALPSFFSMVNESPTAACVYHSATSEQTSRTRFSSMSLKLVYVNKVLITYILLSKLKKTKNASVWSQLHTHYRRNLNVQTSTKLGMSKTICPY